MASSTWPVLRIGIDVGGTFTDVVVVDASNGIVVARVKVPTTHDAPEGVAAGIVAGLERALAEPGVDASRIAFIAHSTTQATNALLEGDVARVGIVALHDRFGWLARRQTNLPPVRLSPNAVFAPRIAFARANDAAAGRAAVDALAAAGVDAVAASDAFGVDRPDRERRIVAYARERGLLATAGHEVATTYGLRARTRTAALNAAILPRMVATATMTARAVERAGIGVPLMIMRSDGGVMDVREVARRPILTMLSGPAAGVAGALLHENVTDGIFIEVGGTSADCSVIRRGMPQMRAARVGGHRTMLRTLDVRTLGIAGGSLVSLDARGGVRAVGPRSAHIAGFRYACFVAPDAFDGATVAAATGDDASAAMDGGAAYAALALRDGTRAALTPTCAANLLGYVPAVAFARGDAESARRAFAIVADATGGTADALARAVLTCATATLRATLDELIDDYELDRRNVELIGGGGGAAALVPFAAEALGFEMRLARDAEVISPLGVALALVREVVERTIVNPSADDVVRVRREAADAVVAAGASPESVEVTVEIDGRRNSVRATASGATAAVARARTQRDASEGERLAAAARALHRTPSALRALPAPDAFAFAVFTASRRGDVVDACIVDRGATVRAVATRARTAFFRAADVPSHLARVIEEATAFGDVGRALPAVVLAYGDRVADLGTLAEAAHVVELAAEELRGVDPDAPVLALASRRDA